MKKLKIVSIAAMSLALLVGCSGGSSSGGGDTPTPTPVGSKYKVTFDLNYEGSTPTVVEVDKDTTVSRPDDPTREGFVFNDWYVDASSSEAFDFNTKITKDTTIYAGWTEVVTHTVTFYMNAPVGVEAEEVYLSVTVVDGKLVTRPEDPELSGYSFEGWYNTAECVDDDTFSFGARVRNDKKAYAKWSAPDWERDVESELSSYLGILSSVYGVDIPEFPSSKYTCKAYLDCLVIEGTEPCYDAYTEALREAGWSLAEEGNKATLDAFGIEMQYGDSKSGGFIIYLLLAGADGENYDEVPEFTLYAGTDQNFINMSTFGVIDHFNNIYKVNLTSGGNCLWYQGVLAPKPEDSTLTDQQYWVEQVRALHEAANATGKWEADYFLGETEIGYNYIIDNTYSLMNQISGYDETAPLNLDILAFSYIGNNYGDNGTTWNTVDASILGAAVKNATEVEATFPEFSFEGHEELMLNGLNTIVRYIDFSDASGESAPQVTLEILGLKDVDSANYAAKLYALALSEVEGWEIEEEEGELYALHAGEEGYDLVGYFEASEAEIPEFGASLEFVVIPATAKEWTPEAAANYVASFFEETAEEIEDGVFYYGVLTDIAVDAMKGYVASLFVPAGFELVVDWTEGEFDDGTAFEACAYINGSTVLEFYVYSLTVWVDAAGNIVEEGTEGATEVNATVLEVYSYTAEAE